MNASNVLSWVRGLAIPLTVLFVFSMMMTSSTVTTDVVAASGILETFTNGETEGMINWTKEDENVDYSIRLPKQSNVLEAGLSFNGTAYFKENVNNTIKSAFDWRQGTVTPKGTLIYDSSGYHLDMATLAPFENERTTKAGSNVYSVASGDFNKDGRMDLVVTNYDSDTATVFLQNAQGKLVKDRNVQTSDQPNHVEVGDLNKDGRTDFAVGTYNGKAINIFKSRSTGGFDKSTISVGRQVLDLDIGDFNNDGLDDIVIAAYNKYGMIYRQSGTGSFSKVLDATITSGGYYWYTYYARGCAAGDFNRDGRTDVAFTVSTSYTSTWSYQYYGLLKVHYQSSGGSISTSHSLMCYAYNYAQGIEAGDVTGDGRDDIIIANHYTSQLRLFTQRASGGFSGTGKSFSGATRPTWPRMADFDGDGRTDVVSGGLGKKFLFLKQKDGALQSSAKKWDSANNIMDVAAGDFNGDGLIDAVTANRDGNAFGLWIQRTEYRGTWTSDPLVQPLLVRYINFTYDIKRNGGDTHIYFSLDGGTEWTEIENATTYDMINRTDTFWLKVTTYSTSAALYDHVKYIHMNMTYQTYPTNLRLDLGRDGKVEWTMDGELDGETRVTGLADALTEYVQNSTHPADEDGYVTVPLEIYSKSPGTMRLYDLHILYNNASRRPELVFPQDKGYVNGTPTLVFVANDTDDDLLKYRLLITSTDFSDSFNTMVFDMRYALYDEEEGEGFHKEEFPAGEVAYFTLPEAYALSDDTTYKWRVMAFDGYLMSRPSRTYVMRIDSDPPTGFSSSPKYSDTLSFTVSWSAEDVTPGAGLAPMGTYDVQYRRSTEPTWNDWMRYTTETSADFEGEEGVTYYFRMRARDAVWNEQLFIGGKGDTQTTVDTQAPTVTFADMPNFQDTRTFLVRWIGSDYVPGSGIKYYDVDVRKEEGPWTSWQSGFKSSQSVYTSDADKTYHFRARATDHGGNMGEWSEVFSIRIDATPPLVILSPRVPLTGDDTWTNLTELTVIFQFRDPESGIRSLEVTVGTEKGLYDVMPPTLFPYPEDNQLTIKGLQLINSYTYFVGVRAENQAGAWGGWEWSDGVLVAIPGPVSIMTYPEGRVSDSKIAISISVEDPRGHNVTLGDLRMRNAVRSGDQWTWSDWQRISNSKTDVTFDGKRGFRYQFKYRAQNELGSWGDFVEYGEDRWVFINNPPVANGGPSQIATEGETIQFSADASEDRDGDTLTYSWDFGDGDTAEGLFANHEYDKPGLYTVTLTVSDGYEGSESTITVYVEEQDQTPGFGPAAAMLAILGAALVAVGLSRTRRRSERSSPPRCERGPPIKPPRATHIDPGPLFPPREN